MNFFQFLKSLDELLFEVVSWLAFYPMTMWRALRHPLLMMDYAEGEVRKSAETRYDDSLSPPILVLLTVLVDYALERALLGENQIVTNTTGVAGLISSDTSLILLRLVAFATFPLIFAVRTVRAKKEKLTRAALEAPFFAQCYLNAPFLLLFSFAATISQVDAWPLAATIAALALPMIAAVYLAFQTAWFRRTLSAGLGAGLTNALIAGIGSLLFLIVVAFLFAGF